MSILTFVDGVQQQGFLGQYPSSFEIHDYYADKNVIAFDVNFDDYNTSEAFYCHCVENYPECYVHMYEDGMCEVRQDLFDDFDDYHDHDPDDWMF